MAENSQRLGLGKQMAIAAALLGAYAIISSGVVGYLHDTTRATIEHNEKQTRLEKLHQLVPANSHDNDMIDDSILVTAPDLLGSAKPQPVYRARKNGRPVAVVLSAIAPDGYSGDIKLLIGIRHDGVLLGVRVVGHRETPGLGDPIEVDRSDWILGFNGKSLSNPDTQGWHVKKDGGVFDQFTGATITPRAVVKAVHNALLYFEQQRETLFAPAAVKEVTRHGQ